jgi:hypothetical protein
MGDTDENKLIEMFDVLQQVHRVTRRLELAAATVTPELVASH